MSKRNTVKFKLDPKNPPALTAEQRKRLAELAEQPDAQIDYSGIPKQTAAVKWSRPVGCCAHFEINARWRSKARSKVSVGAGGSSSTTAKRS